MSRVRFVLPMLALLMLCAALAVAQRPPQKPPEGTRGGKAPKNPAAQLAQALQGGGQLAVLNKQGEPAQLCPLKHTAVKADVAGFVGRVTVTQQFTNPSSEPVEAVYTFPLPED